MTSSGPARGWRVAALCAALALCLWAGWHDVDPWIARDAVREGIRIAIRRGVQVAVQFLALGVLLALLVRELGPGLRGRRRGA